MAWTNLRTDYTDATWSGDKKYQQIFNQDGTISFKDVTVYTNKPKSFFGASDANKMNNAINGLISNSMNESNGSTIIPVVLHKQLPISTEQGPLIIELPVGFIGTILTFDITIANNSDDDSVRYSIVGQVYSADGGRWASGTKAYVNGISETDKDNLTVRFGYIGEKEKAVIAIGEDNTSWSLPMVTVRDFVAYYTKLDLDIWQKGWDCKIGKLGDYTWQFTRENPNQLKISQATIDKFKTLGMK